MVPFGKNREKQNKKRLKKRKSGKKILTRGNINPRNKRKRTQNKVVSVTKNQKNKKRIL